VKGAYHPKNWRKQADFGTGTMGDMGVHIFDPPMLNLALSAPLSVRAQCRAPNGIGHPTKSSIEFEFAPTQYTAGPLTLTWTDGSLPAPHDDLVMPKGEKLPKQGSMFVGEHGRMLLPHIASPQFFPEEKFDGVKFPKQPRLDHYGSWIDKHLGNADAVCRASFEYAAQLTETVLVGGLACRFPGKKLMWDAANMQFSNESAANAFIKPNYRDGFGVAGLG
jgi:predicted dehydrogenase